LVNWSQLVNQNRMQKGVNLSGKRAKNQISNKDERQTRARPIHRSQNENAVNSTTRAQSHGRLTIPKRGNQLFNAKMRRGGASGWKEEESGFNTRENEIPGKEESHRTLESRGD